METDPKAVGFEEEEDPTNRSFFSEIISSISDVKFSHDGRYILSRDYLSLKIWDVNMENKPLKTIPIHDHLRGKLCDLYENDCIFDKFECTWSGDDKYVSWSFAAYQTPPSHERISTSRHVLTGSYHNYFRIFDVETLNDVVLQADKSAFKAKKIGGPLPGNKLGGAKNGMRPGGLRENMASDTLDFNKKILHASWHPRENTIAVRIVIAWISVFSICLDSDRAFVYRLRQRTICSCTALHEYRSFSLSTVYPYLSLSLLSYCPLYRPPALHHYHHPYTAITLPPRYAKRNNPRKNGEECTHSIDSLICPRYQIPPSSPFLLMILLQPTNYTNRHEEPAELKELTFLVFYVTSKTMDVDTRCYNCSRFALSFLACLLLGFPLFNTVLQSSLGIHYSVSTLRSSSDYRLSVCLSYTLLIFLPFPSLLFPSLLLFRPLGLPQ